MKMKYIWPSCDSEWNDALFLELLNKIFCCVKAKEHLKNKKVCETLDTGEENTYGELWPSGSP